MNDKNQNSEPPSPDDNFCPHPSLSPTNPPKQFFDYIGSTIGPYKLTRQLGEGGFGVVYLAEQNRPIKRNVAIKILKPGMDSQQIIARFEAERQTLAMLEHPNIATVLDAGLTDRGYPYFVMQYIDGIPITEYCDQQTMTIKERLKLFRVVCEAIQFAHQKAIIHRDLKPSNILVTSLQGKPVPIIIDFGIAKATDQSRQGQSILTEKGQLVGTLEYMSPEQVAMSNQDIDTRTDIYSLGILLYELLICQLPFDSNKIRQASIVDIQRIIQKEEPLRPSIKFAQLEEKSSDVANKRNSDSQKLSRILKRDLEWIPLKAIHKQREDRYRSITEFLDDIQNYLTGNPIIAKRSTPMYILCKHVRKYYWATAIIVLLLVILSSTSLISFSFYYQTKLAFEELRMQRSNNPLIANKDATQEVVISPDIMLQFINTWFECPEHSPEGMAASAFFVNLRAQTKENCIAGLAARYLLDFDNPLKKQDKYRQTAPIDLQWFVEFLIGEHNYRINKDQAEKAYSNCIKLSYTSPNVHHQYLRKASQRLQAIHNELSKIQSRGL